MEYIDVLLYVYLSAVYKASSSYFNSNQVR